MRSLRGQVAVVGVGESTYYKRGEATDSEFVLTLRAILAACADAGISSKDVDGFASYSNDRNEPSRLAAERLGFSYEGTFCQALIYKGRNRDTAWFSVIDREWPALKTAHEQWLAPDNFDAQGHQIVSLSGLTAALLRQHHWTVMPEEHQ